MRLFRILMVLLLLAGAQSAQSALPGDAAGRQKEMLIHRQEKMALFEKAKQQRATALISRDQQVRQEMTLPPQGGVAAGPSAAVAFSEPSAAVAGPHTPNWVVSIIALLCLGGFVWWVRVKTELRP